MPPLISAFAFNALILLVGQQEGRLARKKTEWWNNGMVIWGDVQICIWPSRCHYLSLSLVPVNPDWFYFSGFTFLVPAYPGSPGQNPEEP